jgi:hypothetical protein
MKHILQLAALLFAITTLISVSSEAAVPQIINYQGRLTNSVGVPLDTTVTLDFTIYKDSLGALDVWSETHPGVVIKDGLFQVLLGSVTPLSESVFNGSKRWLGVQLQGGSAPTEFIPMVSVAYAYRSVKSDTASYAFSSGGTSGGGWTDDGTTVRLSTITDSVGIGTSDPALRLDITGGLRATDSVQTNKLVLGKSSTTTGAMNMYSSLTSLPIVQLFGSSNGGTVQVRDEAGNSSAYLKSSTEPGGLLSIARNAAGTSGFYVDGNTGAEEPKVSVLGSSRSVILDMSESGDSSVMLPYSSISNTEMLNEAGIANTKHSGTTVTLDNTIKTIASRKMSFPTSGYALVIATAYLDFWHIAGTFDQFRFAVSDVAGSIPTDQNYYKDYPAAWDTFNFQDFFTIHGYFSVEAGTQTFYLLGSGAGTSPWVGDCNLTVAFFPTWYGSILKAGEANSPEQEQEQVDAASTARMQAQIDQLRKEFDAKLKVIEDEMKKQLDRGGK